jgi:phosphoglycerate dehydrogenase-like enzyme
MGSLLQPLSLSRDPRRSVRAAPLQCGTMLLTMSTPVLVLSDPGEPQLVMLDELRPNADIVTGNSMQAFGNALAGANVVFNWSGSLDLLRDVVDKCPNLQWVHSRSVGLERTLFPELIESSVTLTNGRGVFSASLGEFALAAILYFAKDLRRMIRNQVAGKWEPFDSVPISGQTVGIIGYGDIGRAVAARVRPMGMKVLAVKRHAPSSPRPDSLVDQFYTPERRLDMLPRCDYVVVSTPLTSETQGLIGEREFAAMKPDAVIINLGRGPVIEERALIQALAEGRIKGAALDVFDQEPLPAGHPFYNLENVLLSPHCADHTPDWLDQAMRFFIEQFKRFRDGQPLLHVVDKKLGY